MDVLGFIGKIYGSSRGYRDKKGVGFPKLGVPFWSSPY